jgi:hypothetical protein
MKIDFLSITAKYAPTSDVKQHVTGLAQLAGWKGTNLEKEVVRGTNGYDFTLQVDAHTTVQFSAYNPRMGVHLGASGQSSILRDFDTTREFRRAVGERWKDTTASRVDIAWDTDVDMSDACRSYFKLNRDNVPTPLLYESRNGGMTLYIGAPSSDKRVRVYNKAAEQDLEGLVWWRYELQLRGRYAKAAWLSHFNDYPKAGASEALWNVGRFGKDVGKVFPRPISLHGGAKWAWDVVLPALSNLIVDGEVSMDTFISNLRDDVARRRLLKNS